ncbi:HD domain-containing phosphohydrolase [Aquibium sp. ELW1220]|uniref:HD domain-containing phosphohydrolase n=1 Tax=Aquibium sp. ELW1220 TaxID=2976766 RepID=UPI0025B06FFC|nr:HD domain-containing phosphohydrolase [Aquibium sp. ELW1220]MDN2581667.1 response regulator [Aquibium sp. ELW1220]
MQLNVLIVEDNRSNLMLMEMLVRQVGRCSVLSYPDPGRLLADLPDIHFDIALVDYQMPGMNGIDLIAAIRADRRFAEKPIVMITADDDADLRLRAIKAGAVEFLTKPLEPVEFKARLTNLARLCEVQLKLADQAEWLRSEVEMATLELRRREEEIINRLTLAAGYKDQETSDHTLRMARYSALIARELGLSDAFCRDLQLAAPMHDIGKVGIRDDVLLKQGSLTASERAHIDTHTSIGAAILAGSSCDLLQLAATIAVSHHEHWDGSGYPKGLSGEDIPLVGRIAAVADVFDALTSERAYKCAWTVDRAFQHLREQAGRHFDPDCVAAFERCREKVLAVMHAYPDHGGAQRRVA